MSDILHVSFSVFLITTLFFDYFLLNHKGDVYLLRGLHIVVENEQHQGL